MKVDADRDRCISAGMCVLTAPNLFDQDDEDGRVRLLVDRPGADDLEAAREAVAMCPSGALTLRDEEKDTPEPKGAHS